MEDLDFIYLNFVKLAFLIFLIFIPPLLKNEQTNGHSIHFLSEISLNIFHIHYCKLIKIQISVWSSFLIPYQDRHDLLWITELLILYNFHIIFHSDLNISPYVYLLNLHFSQNDYQHPYFNWNSSLIFKVEIARNENYSQNSLYSKVYFRTLSYYRKH